MGRPVIDLTGQRFKLLLVIERADSIDIHSRWLCLCDCGNTTYVRSGHLRKNQVISCGYQKGKNISNNTQAGLSHTAAYRSWTAMWRRCTDLNYHSFHRYGGRGITICAEWRTFLNFLADMRQPPHNTWLERKDNNKGYNLDNCKWATPKEQAVNRG